MAGADGKEAGMQLLIIALIVIAVLVYGSKRVTDALRETRETLHEYNMRRRGEKEAEKMREEKEQELYAWKAHCENEQRRRAAQTVEASAEPIGASGGEGAPSTAWFEGRVDADAVEVPAVQASLEKRQVPGED